MQKFLQHRFQAIRDWCAQIPPSVWGMTGLSIIVLSIACMWLYAWMLYPSYDLGIFHQVVWNTAHGRWFAGSFNEWTYLVDHREWVLPLFAPLYWVWADARMLLIAQVVVVSSGAIPVYLIAKKIFTDTAGVSEHVARRAGEIASLCYILHPTIARIQVFEFHILPLVIPATFWLWYAFMQKRRGLFWFWVIFALLVREDVATMMGGVGLLVAWQGRGRQRIDGIVVMVLSVLWFGAMVWLGSELSRESAPLFMTVYSWMGDTPLAALQFMVTHPVQVFLHLLQPNFIGVLLLFWGSTAFFSIFRLRYIVPALGPLAVFGLLDTSIAVTISQFYGHYGSMFFIWFFIAAIYGAAAVYSGKLQYGKRVFNVSAYRFFVIVLIVAAMIPNVFLFGPQWVMKDAWMHRFEARTEFRSVLQYIQPDDAVYGSPRYWPLLATREKLYPVMPLIRGTEHYVSTPVMVKPVDWLFTEHLTYIYYTGTSPKDLEASALRIQKVIADNALAPIALNELGVVYGPQERAQALGTSVSAAPMTTQPRDASKKSLGRIMPNLELTGFSYDEDQKILSIAFLPTGEKEPENGYVTEQGTQLSGNELFLSVTTENKKQKHTDRKFIKLGYGHSFPTLWPSDVETVMRIPYEWPVGEQSVQLQFGDVASSAPLFFWLSELKMNPQTFPGTDVNQTITLTR